MQGIFEYGGVKHELVPAPTGASSEGCERLMKLVLKQNEPCGAEQVCCSEFASLLTWSLSTLLPQLPAAGCVVTWWWRRLQTAAEAALSVLAGSGPYSCQPRGPTRLWAHAPGQQCLRQGMLP